MKKNSKVVLFILTVLFIFVGVIGEKKVQAYDKEGTLIDVDVEGGTDNKFKAGDSVTVKVKLNDVKDLFAASFLYTYDNTFLQVDSVDINEDIQSAGVYEAYKDTAKDGNKARYCFTLLGDREGLSGTYDFATITGKAKQDGEINVGKDNFDLKLIQKKDNDMIKANYNFRGSNGDVYSIENITEDDDENSTQANNGDNSKVGSNKKNKSKVKVELVESASKSNDSSSDNNKDSDKSEESNEKNDEEDVASSSDKNENNKDENLDVSDSKENNSVYKNKYIVLSAGTVIIIAILVIYMYKMRN